MKLRSKNAEYLRTKANYTNVNFRLPNALAPVLDAVCEREKRSRGAQVLFIVENWLVQKHAMTTEALTKIVSAGMAAEVAP